MEATIEFDSESVKGILLTYVNQHMLLSKYIAIEAYSLADGGYVVDVRDQDAGN